MKILHLIINFDEYQLNPKYMEKYAKRSKLAAVIMVYAFNIAIFTLIIAHAIFGIAYFDPNVNLPIILSVIWQVIFALSIYHAISLLYIYVYAIYTFSIYMKYRLRQIGDYLDILI